MARGDSTETAAKKRIKVRLDEFKNDMNEFRNEVRNDINQLTKQMGEVMKALPENQKGKEPAKDGGSVSSLSTFTTSGTVISPEANIEKGDPNRAWIKKVELPTFEGEDPLGWIARAEKFFEIQQVREEEKLRLAFICMEGMAMHWFQFWKDQAKDPTWKELIEAMLQRFGDCAQGTVYERLATVKQRGSVGEYVQDFELLIAQARGVSEEAILGYFLAGLRKSVRDTVRIQDPKRLVQAMATARRVEEAQRAVQEILLAEITEVASGETTWWRDPGRAMTRVQTSVQITALPGVQDTQRQRYQRRATTAGPPRPKPKGEAQGHGSCPTRNMHEDEGKIFALRVEALLDRGINALKEDCRL